VCPLAHSHDRGGLRFVQASQFICKHSRGIDDHFGGNLEAGTQFSIFRHNAHDPIIAFQQPRNGRVIESEASKVEERAQQCDGIAGVVELSIVVKDATLQTHLSNARQPLANAPGREDAGPPKPLTPRQQIVEREPDSVKWNLPSPIRRHYKRSAMG